VSAGTAGSESAEGCRATQNERRPAGRSVTRWPSSCQATVAHALGIDTSAFLAGRLAAPVTRR
jgi:hypothetical protein